MLLPLLENLSVFLFKVKINRKTSLNSLSKMPRRRLRLSYSSDDDELQNQQQEEDNEAELQEPAVPPHLPIPNPNDLSEPVEISDDEEFIDVSDNLSPPSETPNYDNRTPPLASPLSSGGCPISDYLRGLGLRLTREWLDACLGSLERSFPGFVNSDVVGKAKLCFEQFLLSDMNICGAGSLPENVDRLHLVNLPGPYVLQVAFNFPSAMSNYRSSQLFLLYKYIFITDAF